ncbi:2-C-methyl-D-erythritol 2,4-cyclodiphosphate synthase [bacterium]|nr:2-C-methyl-D-erythritol 2,4-cyclodiphosphate synthase [bacterium]
MYRIGIGYDIHALGVNRDLIIGGVKIPHTLGLIGHSDADVLIHAIIDAMFGALALGDIGTHFPDTDDAYKGISSVILLDRANNLIHDEGYTINNLDCNIIAQEPKMKPHIPAIRKTLAKVLKIDVNLISVKAKTKEKMDSVGEKRAIEANAVVMLRKEI